MDNFGFVMQFVGIFIFLLLCSLNSSVAEAKNNFTKGEIRAHTRVHDIHVTSIIKETELGLRGLSNVLKRSVLEEWDAHNLFHETANALTAVRAILYIGADGKLQVDSFSYPLICPD